MSMEAKEERPIAYIAGRLTGLPPTKANQYKKMYESAAQICEELGFKAYLPHEHTDPLKHPLVSPTEVYLTDTGKVRDAKIVIAFIDEPSFGVGTELGYAAVYETFVILVHHLGVPVSRMVFGNPSVIGIVPYSKWEEAIEVLRQTILSRAELINISDEIVDYYREQEEASVKFILPITHNDGQPVLEDEFKSLEYFLIRRFGGCSC